MAMRHGTEPEQRSALRVRPWIDIDNPPQVQYLAPFVDALRARGRPPFVTARDYGITAELLQARGIAHELRGAELGGGRLSKVLGTVRRAAGLVLVARRLGPPDFVLCTSRSAAMAARILRIPSFMVLDYEHAELGSFRLSGTTVLHPDVIDRGVFHEAGFAPERLVAFDGLKEDISFAGRDIDATPPADFGIDRGRLTVVLVRPPSETSHYFDPRSRELTEDVIRILAADERVQVVLSPRTPSQRHLVKRVAWRNDPILLSQAVDFVSLLRGVDWVICAGGTMLREAAYLGVPAISLFRSEAGAVDRHLERLGLVRFLDRADDLEGVDWASPQPAQPLRRNPRLLDELADLMIEHAAAHQAVKGLRAGRRSARRRSA